MTDTREDIQYGQITESLNDKLDRDFSNSIVPMDFVVATQKPTTENGNTWYRLYKSGWIEQGGKVSVPGAGGIGIILPKEMFDTKYSVSITGETVDGGTMVNDCFWCIEKTTSKISIDLYDAGHSNACFWEVRGFAKNSITDEETGETIYGNTYNTYFYSGLDPDYAHGTNITVSTTEKTYTCTQRGRIDYFLGYDNDTNGTYIKINNVSLMSTTVSSGYPRLLCGTIDVRVGDVIKYKVNTTSTTSKMTFYPYLSPTPNPTVTQIIDAIYPVGSIYIGTTINCPIASIVGTWTKIDGDLVLQSSSTTHAANTTIDAGLPNITGRMGVINDIGNIATDGAFHIQTTSIGGVGVDTAASAGWSYRLDASRSSSIYGNSDTVQPPAYVVNVWRRTA